MSQEERHCDRCDLLVDVRIHQGIYVRDPEQWICLACAEIEARTT